MFCAVELHDVGGAVSRVAIVLLAACLAVYNTLAKETGRREAADAGPVQPPHLWAAVAFEHFEFRGPRHFVIQVHVICSCLELHEPRLRTSKLQGNSELSRSPQVRWSQWSRSIVTSFTWALARFWLVLARAGRFYSLHCM